MKAATRDVIHECTRASDEERIGFGEVVVKLIDAGVERYHADLVHPQKTYYLPNGDSEIVPCAAIDGTPAESFSGAAVEAAVKAIQAGQIQYRTFCRRVVEAGCVGYLVSMAGRRVIYYGRTGDNHVEWFPGAR